MNEQIRKVYCEVCHLTIGTEEPRHIHNGKAFHTTCWHELLYREMKRQEAARRI